MRRKSLKKSLKKRKNPRKTTKSEFIEFCTRALSPVLTKEGV